MADNMMKDTGINPSKVRCNGKAWFSEAVDIILIVVIGINPSKVRCNKQQ